MQHSSIKIVETDEFIFYPETSTLDYLKTVKKDIDKVMSFLLFACDEKKLKIGFQLEAGWVGPGATHRHTDDEIEDLVNEGKLDWRRNNKLFGKQELFDKNGVEWTYEREYFDDKSPESKSILDLVAEHFGVDRDKESDERDAVLLAVQMQAQSKKKMLYPEEWKKLKQPV